MTLFGVKIDGGALVALIAIPGTPIGLIVIEWARKLRPREEVRADVATKVADSFTKLVDQQQEEIARYAEQVRLLREEGHRLKNQAMKLQAYAQVVVRSLTAHIDSLEALVRSLGGTLPPRPDLPPLSD